MIVRVVALLLAVRFSKDRDCWGTQSVVEAARQFADFLRERGGTENRRGGRPHSPLPRATAG